MDTVKIVAVRKLHYHLEELFVVIFIVTEGKILYMKKKVVNKESLCG